MKVVDVDDRAPAGSTAAPSWCGCRNWSASPCRRPESCRRASTAVTVMLPLAAFDAGQSAGQRAERGLQFGDGRNFAAAGAERDRQRRIGADLDCHRLPLPGRALGQQVGGIDGAHRQAELVQQGRRRAGDLDRRVGVDALEIEISADQRGSEHAGRNAAGHADAVAGHVAERIERRVVAGERRDCTVARRPDQLAGGAVDRDSAVAAAEGIERRIDLRRGLRGRIGGEKGVDRDGYAAVEARRLDGDRPATMPTVPPAPVKPVAPFRATAALMAISTWAGVMPAWMFTFCPLIVNVPPFAMVPGTICVPVIFAAASAGQRRAEAGDLGRRRRAGHRIGRIGRRIDQFGARRCRCRARG